MFIRKISLAEALRDADEAKNYARDRIKKGNTQLENNNLSETYFDFLREGMSDTRDIWDQKTKETMVLDPLEKNPNLASYETIISITSKYSLGNCYELAAQALDYVLNHTSADINAELYQIRGGGLHYNSMQCF